MKKAKQRKAREPSRASLRDIPEIDFSSAHVRRNPYAAVIAKSGITIQVERAKQLFERLENQLCNDYLRDTRSSRGLFVLVHQSRKKEWELPDGCGRVDFAGLVEAMAKHWAAISDRFPGVDEIHVCGIGLTKRSA